jgi:ubiquinone/menaquinone biosynthesis C-methylase UbiE
MNRYLAERGCRVEGVDLSGGMISMARRVHPDLSFRVGTLSELPLAADHFAGLLLWYPIIHAAPAELARAFREVVRVL